MKGYPVSELVTVIMAAGKGKRMKSDLPKVLHPINNRPMVHYVIDLANRMNSKRVVLIVGHKRELVEEACRGMKVEYAVQSEQLGTGHAVLMTEPLLKHETGDMLVLSGDVPLLTDQTIQSLLRKHLETDAVATLLTSELDDPTGYGRIIRDKNGFVQKIVEEKDATPEERKVREINVGIYVFRSSEIFPAIRMTNNQNAQGEYYLPDVASVFIHQGKKVVGVKTPNFDETRGINNTDQLLTAETILKNRR